MKIAFMGAGSTIFAKNILGDCLCSPILRDAEIALYDIDGVRLAESERIIRALNAGVGGKAVITAHHGPGERKNALRGGTVRHQRHPGRRL